MCFDHLLAVGVGMGIVKVIMVSLGWRLHLEGVWLAVQLDVLGELLHPIVLDVKVYDQKVVPSSGGDPGVSVVWVEWCFLLVDRVLPFAGWFFPVCSDREAPKL